MSFYQDFKNTILDITNDNFSDRSLALFDYQYHTNETYRSYCSHLKIKKNKIRQLEDIPFLPIEFFKKNEIKSELWTPEKIFFSSGTTRGSKSKQLVRDLDFFRQMSKRTYEEFYGPLDKQVILALLPSYLEQGHSSLIEMVNYFLNHAEKGSGYIDIQNSNMDHIFNDTTRKTLIGVSYALLDLAAKKPSSKNLSILETGGMKGRKKEIVREQLHHMIDHGFHPKNLFTEYGMTELHSQAYAKENGNLMFPAWARCLIRDVNDPFTFTKKDMTGGINIIDLANISTCAFIETKDLGRKMDAFKFKVMGRFDDSEIRGCNQLF
tara:strand:+ start:2326 stop:3294 length:969 start_codon:yes stop_codon:yes gene_type:complete